MKLATVVLRVVIAAAFLGAGVVVFLEMRLAPVLFALHLGILGVGTAIVRPHPKREDEFCGLMIPIAAQACAWVLCAEMLLRGPPQGLLEGLGLAIVLCLGSMVAAVVLAPLVVILARRGGVLAVGEVLGIPVGLTMWSA
jgi:hypothetical protein